MEKIIDKNWWGRTDEYEVVTEFPHGYIIWNIGRHNFRYPGYIPLAKPDPKRKYYILLNNLKALKLEDEGLCLKLLNEAQERTVDAPTFFEILADYTTNKTNNIK